jgi:hypothetical protein
MRRFTARECPKKISGEGYSPLGPLRSTGIMGSTENWGTLALLRECTNPLIYFLSSINLLVEVSFPLSQNLHHLEEISLKLTMIVVSYPA